MDSGFLYDNDSFSKSGFLYHPDSFDYHGFLLSPDSLFGLPDKPLTAPV
jgi:hypothetical protein